MTLIAGETYRDFTLVSIDPGLNNTGVTVLSVNLIAREIVSLVSFTIRTDNQISDLYPHDYMNDRSKKFMVLSPSLEKAFHFYRPDCIVYETPFFFGAKPMAFGALSEVVSIIKLAAINYNSQVPVYGIEPTLIKKIVKSKDYKDKEGTRTALQVLGFEKYIDFTGLDEHSIDSISVGYAFLKNNDYI